MTKRSWIREYCEKTTSHGMQYFVMKQRSRIEKLVKYYEIYFIKLLVTYYLRNTNYLLNFLIQNDGLLRYYFGLKKSKSTWP